MSQKTWKIRRLANPTEILDYLKTDRLYAAYAIGDLEPGMFEQSGWVGAEMAGRLDALVLLFRGLRPPALFLMGNTGGLGTILENIQYPERVYLTCRSKHLPMTHDRYAWDKIVQMWRMVLQPDHFQPAQGDCIRLLPAHHELLTELYTLGGGDAFDLTQLQRGVFYGILVENRLAAVAGTHLVSPTYGVAAVGNIFTYPDYRGRGYATVTTSAVVTELLARGIIDVVLNVSESNRSAIRVYERLGFERYCSFLEGPASAHRIAIHNQKPRRNAGSAVGDF